MQSTKYLQIWPDIDLTITPREDGCFRVAVFNRKKETSEHVGLFSEKGLSDWLKLIRAQKQKQTEDNNP